MLTALTMLLVAGAALGVARAFGGARRRLKIGDLAPDFALPGSDGRTHRLADLRGTTVVLAWFPKAFTSG